MIVLISLLLFASSLAAEQSLTLPIDNIKQLSAGYYNKREYGLHRALDFPCIVNTPVRAVASGIVIEKGYEYPSETKRDAYGIYIRIKDYTESIWTYAHLNAYDVKLNERISQGQYIALSGSTGLSSFRPHLHLDKQINGQKVFFTKDFGIHFKLSSSSGRIE